MQLSYSSIIRIGLALLAIAAITFTARLLPVNSATIGFIYLMLILAVATLWGRIEAVVTSLVAVLCYDFFFIPPLGFFTIENPQNWVALFTFLATALVASSLSDRAKKEAEEAKGHQRETEQLYALSRAILLTDPSQSIGSLVAHQITQIFEASAIALFDAKSESVFFGGDQDFQGIEPQLKEVVQRNSANDSGIWPIALGGHAIGALAAKGMTISDGALKAMLNLVAIALERVRNEEAAKKAEVSRQSEEFKSTLLDAIAHEFKTPLTSIKAASTSMLASKDSLSPEHREMASIIDEESDRLCLLVTEAVKMSQIDAGKVKLHRSAINAGALLRSAIASFSGRGDERIQLLDSLSDSQLLADREMITLALRQLIDNALKYTPPSTTIHVSSASDKQRVIISITDQGPGIPERDRERIFEKFYRRQTSIPGTGLGLHIAREIARIHGGDLWVNPDHTNGSEFCLALPRLEQHPE